jgi:heptosyltransferase III
MPGMVPRRNVLIFHSGALGDFVLTWPLALALGRLHPQSRIVYITHASKGRLAERMLGIESADVEQGWHCLFSTSTEPPPTIRRSLAAAHSIFSFMTSGQDVWMERVHTLAPQAMVQPLQPRPPEDYREHVTRFLVEQLHETSAVRAAVEQMLRSIQERGIGGRRLGGEQVLIHPGSGSPEKCWPIPCFVQLARRLAEQGRSVRFLLGEAELERWGQEQVRQLLEVATVDRPANYMELLDRLLTARLFIGNDSGPGHLAALIGLPTISLFCATDPTVWRPLGPMVEVLHAQSPQVVRPDDVFAAASVLLSH